MEPMNYTFGGPDPYKMAMDGFQGGLNASQQRGDMAAQAQGMQLAQNQDARAQTQLGLAQNQDARAAQSADQQAVLFGQEQSQFARQQSARQGIAALTALGSNATSEDFAAFLGAHPEVSQEAVAAFSAYSTAKQDNYLKFGAQVYTAINAGSLDTATAMLKQRQAAAENSGDKQEADFTKGLLMQIEMNPDAAATTLRLFGDASTGGAFSKMIDAATGSGGSKTVQSTTPYTDGTSVIVFNDGSKQVSDAAGNILSGQAAVDAVTAGNAAEAQSRGDNSGAATAARNDANVNNGGDAARVIAQGSATGTAQAAATQSLSGDITSAETALAQIAAVRDDPSLGVVTGSFQGNLGEKFFMGSQPATDLLVKIKQLNGVAFLQAFESLKGGGAITQIEGQQAKDAIARLDRAQSMETYQASLDELSGILRKGLENSKKKAGQSAQAASPPINKTDLIAAANAALDRGDRDEAQRIIEQLKGMQ